MSSKNNSKKLFQFNSGNKNYILSLSSNLNDNQEKLFIKLQVILKDSKTDFYFEKTLLEIHNEYKQLKQFLSIQSLIEYFSQLIKHNKMKISLVNNFIFYISLIDIERNIFIKLLLKRKIEANEKTMEEIGNQMVKMFTQIENMNSEIQSQNSKYEKLQENYNNLNEKYEELVKSIIKNNNNKNNISKEESIINNDNNNNNDNRRSSIKNVRELNISMSIKSNKDNINENIVDDDNNEKENDKYINKLSKSSFCYYSKNSEINQSNISISQQGPNNNVKDSLNHSYNILKENNCQITFKRNPKTINNTKYIMDSNSNDQCEIFTAFSINLSVTIIAWVTKNENNKIWLKKWGNEKCFELNNAHNSKINVLQYFYNENSEINYIISLSINDKDTLKIWNIDLIELELKHINTINIKMSNFYMFSCKFLSRDITYLIGYTKNNNQKNICIYKLDNDFNFVEKENLSPSIECTNEVNFLDVFFHRENNEFYLINCNNYDVKIIFQPFENDDNFNIKSYKKSNNHLHAFIFENHINNTLELFEANIEGIYIWDFNNNNAPIKEIPIGPVFDMCLWNEEFLFASTNQGFKLIQIEEENVEKTIDECSKIRNGSKIRKINAPGEGPSIVGINSDRKLCLWTN